MFSVNLEDIKTIGPIFTIISTVVIWFCNERSKRIDLELQRKETRYEKLIKSLKGFYITTQNKELKDDLYVN